MLADSIIPNRCARWLLAAVAGISFTGCACLEHKPVQPAPHVDLDSYMGDWFVVAAVSGAMHNGWQRPIERYLFDSDGQIQTTFLAWNPGGHGGKLVIVPGVAKVTDPKTNSVWALTGGAPFKPQIVILQVAPDYHYAAVSTPDGRHAWILSRTRRMSDEDYDATRETLRKNGIRPSRLKLLPQP